VTEYRTILDRFDGALYECFDYFMHHHSGNPNDSLYQSKAHSRIELLIRQCNSLKKILVQSF